MPLAGKTGTVNDHTDVWFIGYTPTYVTGVWMGYPGRKKPLGNDMTGGHGALPFFIDFMKDFLKDKPKEDFEKAPAMPEDMKELEKQRQREMMENRLDMIAARGQGKKAATDEAADTITAPKMEQITLPPAPKMDEPPPVMTAPPPVVPAPKKTETTTAPPPAATRPREVEQPKKKGKKGNDEP